MTRAPAGIGDVAADRLDAIAADDDDGRRRSASPPRPSMSRAARTHDRRRRPAADQGAPRDRENCFMATSIAR